MMNTSVPRVSLENLLDRWKTGDQRAATEIFKRYEQAVIRYARQRIGPKLRGKVSPDSVLLLVMEYILRGASHGKYSDKNSQEFLSLLKRKAEYVIWDKARENKKKPHEIRPDNDPEIGWQIFSDDRERKVDARAIFADDLEKIRQRLGPGLFVILQLLMDGYSDEEIAQHLDVSCSTLWRREKKIKELLRTASGDGQDK
jgi:RNA polymerase sigma-70 factor, ECF subfamily